MNRIVLVLLLLVAPAGISAQHSSRGTDAIGAHINYGRGCPACHVPHSPAFHCTKNDLSASSSDRASLWGDEGTNPYPTGESENAPKLRVGATANSPETMGIITCRSCHDGNYAPASMIKNTVYETLPDQMYGPIDPVPTLMDKPSVDMGRDFGQHPVGLGVRIGCGGPLNWDCTQQNGAMVMGGTHSSRFAANYGFFLKQHTVGNNFVVVCTTCHNPHSMNVTRVTKDSHSKLYPPGTYPTTHFLRAPYDARSTSTTGNQSAQFCRECHADKSNEMNNGNMNTTM